MIKFILVDGDGDILYNKITDPDSRKSFYPDICVPHSFSEAAVCDREIYNEYREAVAKYGTAHCFAVSCRTPWLLSEFEDNLTKAYSSLPSPTPFNSQLLSDTADGLMLSATMRSSFQKLINYYSTIGDADAYLRDINTKYALPVPDKKKGKQIYELIRKDIME